MNDFNNFVKEQLNRKEVAREYYRLAPFYRLADQLVLLRKQRGLTQQELAEKAQTTQAVVSRLENVTVHCSLESVIRLAEALDASVEVRLTPLEELSGEDDQVITEEIPTNTVPCPENDDALLGIVYFRQPAQKPCSNILWSRPDPQTGQIYTPQEPRRLKVMEVA